MFPTARVAWRLPVVLAGLLIINVPSVRASEAVDATDASAAVTTLAALPLELPGARVAMPIVPAPSAQPRPLELSAPRLGAGGFDSAALRRSTYVAFGVLQVLDGVSTRQALSTGAREANPMMAGIAGNSAALFAVKAGTAAATTYLAERLAKKHPRRAVVLMLAMNVGYAAIVAHNYRVANGR